MSKSLDSLFNEHAEIALITAPITDSWIFDKVGDMITGEDFGDKGRGEMWEALKTMHQAGTAFDLPMIVSTLKAAGIREDLRSPLKIGELIRVGSPDARFIEQHAAIVKDLSLKRQQVAILENAIAVTQENGKSSSDVTQWIDARMQSLGTIVNAPIRRVDEIAADVVRNLREPKRRSGQIMTGLKHHDEMCGGFLGSEMVIIAARPGEGKTVLGMQIAKHAALRNLPVLFVSLEMKDRELITRMLCGLSGVNSLLIRNGSYTDDHVQRIEDSSQDLEGVPLHVWDQPGATTAKIRAVAKQMKSAGGLGFLVVDYLGKVKPVDYRVSRADQIGQIARDLKDIAKELDIPVLVLCQLNRGADDEVPKLKNLADSSDVEREADVVLFLHPDKKANKTRLIVAKHRHGETGLLEIVHNKKRMCFDEPEPDWVAKREEESADMFDHFNQSH